jgi:hypothetical protein
MKLKFIFLSIFFFGFALSSLCQENVAPSNKALDYYSETDQLQKGPSGNENLLKGNSYPEELELLTSAYWEKKKNYGYKVQVFSGKSRWEANKVRSELINNFQNEISAEVVYQAPNFKVRVGNHRDRLAATKQLLELKEAYPGAFIVKDEIKLPKQLRE